jgi:hypothetical protein
VDEQNTKKKRFNVVDVLILVIVLAVAGFFIGRYAVSSDSGDSDDYELRPFVMILESFETPDVRFVGKIAVGDIVTTVATGVELGTLTNIEVNPSITFTTTADGRVIQTSTPMHSHLIFTIEGKGYRPEGGGLAVDRFHSMVNKEFEFNVGDNAFFMRFIHLTIEGDDA